MTLKTYLETLITEKGQSLGTCILKDEGQFNLTYQIVIDFLGSIASEEQEFIRSTLVEIDFKNGDVFHFILFLAREMIKALGLEVGNKKEEAAKQFSIEEERAQEAYEEGLTQQPVKTGADYLELFEGRKTIEIEIPSYNKNDQDEFFV